MTPGLREQERGSVFTEVLLGAELCGEETGHGLTM